MKTLLSLGFCVAFAGLTSAFGQLPAPSRPHSVSLNVEPISTGGTSTISQASKNRQSKTTGSTTAYQTTKTETTTVNESIQITVRNFGQQPDTVQVEWYFVSAPAKLDLTVPVISQLSIFDKGSKSVTINSGATQAFPVTSTDLTSELKRSAKTRRGSGGGMGNGKGGATEETGSDLGGWMVRLVADGKTLDSRVSKNQLAEVIKDDAKLTSMSK